MPKNNINLEDILMDRSAKDNLVEVQSSSTFFKVFTSIIILSLFVILFQIINLGIIKNDLYSRLAFANTTETSSEAAPRGLILDRYGDVIVGNSQIFRVYLSPEHLPNNESDRLATLIEIGDVLNISVDEIMDKADNHDWHSGRLLLDNNLSHEEIVRIRSKEIPGLETEIAFKRVHSKPFVFSHVAGYTGLTTQEDLTKHDYLRPSSDIGKMGLELIYNQDLQGQRGEEIVFFNASGDKIEERKMFDPQPGDNLETFLDKDLQEYLYQRLDAQLNRLGSKGGAGIVMNPSTGEVLALVSLPSFDNNNIADYLNDQNSPFLNRVIAGRYSPGSIIKPLVAIASLEESVVSPEDRFFSSGKLEVENPYNPSQPSVFHDWKAHGWVDMYSSLARSSNVYYYIVGGGHDDQQGLGISRLNKWWNKFNFDEKTGVDLPGEISGLLPNPNWKKSNVNDIWRLGDTYNVSIGQGDLELTPISLINYINSIANKGLAYKPRVANKGDKEVLFDLREDIDDSSIMAVHKGMVDTVEKSYGTAHTMNDLPFSFAGKTGSSQVGGGETNAFFVGYGPKDDPEVSILIFIEEAREGSLNAVPVARDVMLWYYENRLNE